MNKHQILTKNLITLLLDAVRKFSVQREQVLGDYADLYSVSFLLIGNLRITSTNPEQDFDLEHHIGPSEIEDALDVGVESQLRCSLTRVEKIQCWDFCADGRSLVYDAHHAHSVDTIISRSDVVDFQDEIEGLMKKYADAFRELGPAKKPKPSNVMKALPAERKKK